MEDQLVRDIFIANIRELELQRRFYKKLRAPDEVLREVQAFERGVADQAKLKSLKAGRDLSPYREAKSEVSIKQEPGIKRLSGNSRPKNKREWETKEPKAYFRCGKTPLVKDHQLKCPAKGQECQSCGKTGHFEKVCGNNGKNPKGRSGKVRLIVEGRDSEDEMNELKDNTRSCIPPPASFTWIAEKPKNDQGLSRYQILRRT